MDTKETNAYNQNPQYTWPDNIVPVSHHSGEHASGFGHRPFHGHPFHGGLGFAAAAAIPFLLATPFLIGGYNGYYGGYPYGYDYSNGYGYGNPYGGYGYPYY